jgi:hypothetical protein
MEEAAAVREAALEAVGDVVPDRLRDDIETFVTDGSLVPGVLTLLAAGVGEQAEADGSADADGPDDAGDGARITPAGDRPLAERAAGVQLIYDGLRLTRRLVHEEPWSDADASDPEADLDVLAADVLVARGFYLLARTAAADVAVEVVRSFGRDQTARRGADGPVDLDRELERDVLWLAMVAGGTAAGRRPGDADALVDDLAATYDDGFPTPEELIDEAVRDRVATAVGGSGQAVNRNG